MNHTITVKGIGKVTVPPDYVVLSMSLSSQDTEYEKAMNGASEQIASLESALNKVGFEKEALKTTHFNVHTEYEYRCKKDGTNERIFRGYVVEHHLKVEFDFEAARLAEALSAVGSCLAHPQLSISFTVKDETAVKEEMLRAATENAKRKAEVLCEAAGKTLGDLLTIDYNWGETRMVSNTCYGVEEECLAIPQMAKNAAIDMAPEDIHVSDTATFVWEMN